jgi:hypothetical protein
LALVYFLNAGNPVPTVLNLFEGAVFAGEVLA